MTATITIVIIVSLVFLLVLALGAIAIWYFMRRRETKETEKPVNRTPAPRAAFRWSYIVLPIAILIISIILALVFYPQLTDQVSYRFNADGSARSLLSRQMFTLFMLAPQLFLAFAALAVTWGAARLAPSLEQAGAIRSERILPLMGNMVALPQLVLAFVMLDVFSYNIHQTHLMPVWLFALVIMLIGGVVLTVLFVRAVKPPGSSNRYRKEE